MIKAQIKKIWAFYIEKISVLSDNICVIVKLFLVKWGESMKEFLQYEKGKNILNSRIAKINEKEFFTYIDFVVVVINSSTNTTSTIKVQAKSRKSHIEMTKDNDLAIEMQFEDNSFKDIKPLIGQECIRAYVNPVTDGMDIYANWRICGLACEFKADEMKNTISFVIRYNSAELVQMWPNGNVGERIAVKILDI